MRTGRGASIESHDAIVVEGRFTGTHTGPLAGPRGTVASTGRAIDVPFVDIFWLRQNRVHSHHIYLDQLTVITQQGLAPAPAAQPA